MDSLPPRAKLMACLEDESCPMPGGASDGNVCNVSRGLKDFVATTRGITPIGRVVTALPTPRRF